MSRYEVGRMLCAAAFAAVGLGVAGCLEVQPPDNDIDGRSVSIGLPTLAPPFSTMNAETGAFEGWSVDLIHALSERANFQPSFHAIESAALLESLESGAVDVVPVGIPLTIDNFARVGFSSPYLFLDHRLIVNASSQVEDILTFRVVAERPVGIVAGDTEVAASVEAFFGAQRVQVFPTAEETLRAIFDSVVSAAVLDEIEWGRRRVEGLRSLPGAIYVEAYALAAARDSELLGPISFALEELRRDGTLEIINARWGLPPIATPPASVESADTAP